MHINYNDEYNAQIKRFTMLLVERYQNTLLVQCETENQKWRFASGEKEQNFWLSIFLNYFINYLENYSI